MYRSTLHSKKGGWLVVEHKLNFSFRVALVFIRYISKCQIIIENVVDKNPKVNSGETPLHQAALNGHLEICQLIIENVEDKNPTDNSGYTPLDAAIIGGHKKLVDILVTDATNIAPMQMRTVGRYR